MHTSPDSLPSPRADGDPVKRTLQKKARCGDEPVARGGSERAIISIKDVRATPGEVTLNIRSDGYGPFAFSTPTAGALLLFDDDNRPLHLSFLHCNERLPPVLHTSTLATAALASREATSFRDFVQVHREALTA